jgi:hypothetical protein
MTKKLFWFGLLGVLVGLGLLYSVRLVAAKESTIWLALLMLMMWRFFFVCGACALIGSLLSRFLRDPENPKSWAP